MKKYILVSIFLILPMVVIGQNKERRYSVNLGMQQASTYEKLFWSQTTPGFVPNDQESYTFFDINFLQSSSTKKTFLNTVLGVGINQKGFKEKGFEYLSDPGAIFYTSIIRRTYITFFGGIDFEIIHGNKIKISVAQLLTPEIDLTKTDLFKRFLLGTRTTILVTQETTKKFSLSLSPFFQTALSKYNDSKLTEESSNYFPFCYGFELGLVFNK